MPDRSSPPYLVDAKPGESRRSQRERSPHLRRVLTRLLFLCCFGVGDFSIVHGRHAMASPRPKPLSTLAANQRQCSAPQPASPVLCSAPR
jgi:hypothetical protein